MRSIESIIQNPRNEIHTAGRIMLLRSFGKLMFGTLQDMTGQIQFALSKEFCMLCQDGEELQETPPTPPYQGGGVNPLSV